MWLFRVGLECVRSVILTGWRLIWTFQRNWMMLLILNVWTRYVFIWLTLLKFYNISLQISKQLLWTNIHNYTVVKLLISENVLTLAVIMQVLLLLNDAVTIYNVRNVVISGTIQYIQGRLTLILSVRIRSIFRIWSRSSMDNHVQYVVLLSSKMEDAQ